MNERLKEVRKSMNMNQTEFANLLGVGQSTLAMMEVSKRDVSDRHIKTICAICHVNEQWLRTGEGEMFDVCDDYISEIAQQRHMTSFQENMLRIVSELSLDQQDMLIDLARRLAASAETAYERDGRIVTAALRKYDEEHDDPGEEAEPDEDQQHA